uniref:hypothetical protein n=1 Tax=Pseudomonas sp. PS02285 TaxID=2991441 RepID=UPI00249BD14B
WDDGSTVFADNGPADMVAQLPEIQTQVGGLTEQILAGDLTVCDALNDPTSADCVALGLGS